MPWDDDVDGEYDDEEPSYEEGLVFVGMRFDGKENADRWYAIKDECARLGLDPARADTPTGSTQITEDVKDLIDRAEFVIFDLSGDRPSVYHEVGYAEKDHPLEDTLLLAAAGTKPAFNIASRRIRFYNTTEDLRKIVRRELRAMMAVHAAAADEEDDE